jgi:hypothetical protein
MLNYGVVYAILQCLFLSAFVDVLLRHCQTGNE